MFKERSNKKELLDELSIEKLLLFQNLKELEFINKYLGGHAISINGLEQLLTNKTKTYNIIDIGCGGGDSAKAIARWSKSKSFRINISGIDLKEDCIEFAQNNCKKFSEIDLKCADFRTAFSNDTKIDIVHASLFCHHFKEAEIVEFIKLCNKNQAVFIINDLERNPIAYYLIKILTRIFSKSSLVKNDAPLSVLRGFKKREWSNLLKEAGINNFSIKNKWAFRHLLLIYPNDTESC